MKRIVTLLLVVLTTITGYAQEGAWTGELDIQGTKLPLVFHFDDDGCTMDSPAQGAIGIKAEKSYSADGKVKVAIPSIGASFEGYHVMKMITGTFFQGSASLPLTLRPRHERPQTPKAPFPYQTEEVTFQNGEFSLHGTLTVPEQCTKDTPVLVMVTGSGKQNRDEEMMGHRPFAVIADALARHGIATMRYDDCGFEDKAFPFLNYTIADHKTDAEAGIKMVRNRFNKVGVIGHSEGGTIALMLASEGKVDFCVSLAGMAVSGKETLLEQNRIQLEAFGTGLSSEDKSTFYDVLDKTFDAIVAGKRAAEIDDSNVPDALKDSFRMSIAKLSSRYMRDFLTVDIHDSLAKVTCPVLAMNGKKDTQVNAKVNLSAIDKGLTNCKHEVVAFDGLNHLFQHCQTGMLNEYQTIEETFAPEALDKIIEWVKGI